MAVVTAFSCAQDPIVGEEYPTALAARVVSYFDLPSPLEAYEFPERGNIHHDTYLIRSGRPSLTREYLLQRINQQVFAYPDNVMAAMTACLEAQRRNLARDPGSRSSAWEPITLVPTRSGALYLENRNLRGTTYWRLMEKIPGCVTYKSLGEVADRPTQLALAEQAGRGLAIYIDLTADMDVKHLASPLPGYRNTRIYYDQLKSVLQESRSLDQAAGLLPDDDTVLRGTAQHFLVHLPHAEAQRRRTDPEVQPIIDLVMQEEAFGLTLLRGLADGSIRTVAIHGDTKLDNFLFCARTGRAKSLVDLDTIMPHTWLADWGDMVRSLVNLAGEKESDLTKVGVDQEIYRAIARGFLATVRRVTAAEVALMSDAVEMIALELGVRFLADYLRGNTYFKLTPTDPPDLNKVRARVQLELFKRLRDHSGALKQSVIDCYPRPARGDDFGSASHQCR
jgi:N-acetylhexosamine 1-kinase